MFDGGTPAARLVRVWKLLLRRRQLGAGVTHWRVSAFPSALLAVPGVSRVRWLAKLTRVRSRDRAISSWKPAMISRLAHATSASAATLLILIS